MMPGVGATLARGSALGELEAKVLETFFRVEAVDLARRLGGGLVPEPEVIAVGVVDEGPDAVLPLQAVGVTTRLGTTDFRVCCRLLGLDHGQRFVVFTEESIIRRALPCGRGLVADGELLANLVRAHPIFADLPASLSEENVDQHPTGRCLVEAESVRGLARHREGLLLLGER